MNNLLIVKGNIVKLSVDAIVNASNTSLLGGGGVDGAIHKEAGPELLKECQGLNGCETGEAKITGGYKLKAKYVIHTPGPIWRGGGRNEDTLLANCYKNSLNVANEHGVKSIAFPAIGTGIYKFPVEKSAEIAISECMNFLHYNDINITLVCFDEKTKRIYDDMLKSF